MLREMLGVLHKIQIRLSRTNVVPLFIIHFKEKGHYQEYPGVYRCITFCTYSFFWRPKKKCCGLRWPFDLFCHRLFSSSPAEVAHQFQYAVRVIGSNYAPSIERDEFLVSEKIKKERKCLFGRILSANDDAFQPKRPFCYWQVFFLK